MVHYKNEWVKNNERIVYDKQWLLFAYGYQRRYESHFDARANNHVYKLENLTRSIFIGFLTFSSKNSTFHFDSITAKSFVVISICFDSLVYLT